MVFRFLLVGIGLLLVVCGAMAQVPGDVDGNGVVGQPDAEMLAVHLLGLSPLNVSAEERADCNGQSGLDAGDLIWIVNNNECESGPEMLFVPAGAFQMGDPWAEGRWYERPVHTVTLSAYQIGRHEVTNAEYAAFLNSASVTVVSGVVYLTSNVVHPLFDTYPSGSSYSQIAHSEGAFSVRTRDGYSMNDHPVVMVSWFGAAAYCNWLSHQQGYEEVYTESGYWQSDLSRNGYHLPTEAQWERAAAWDPNHAGSSNDPVSPELAALGHWRYGFMSDSIDNSHANYTEYYPVPANPLSLTSYPYTSPVGFYSGTTTGRTGPTVNSPSAVGCYDMSGNVWECCNDWYSSTYYNISPGTDPEGPSPQSNRVIRGSGWYNPYGLSSDCRSAVRGNDSPYNRWFEVGFRVARNP